MVTCKISELTRQKGLFIYSDELDESIDPELWKMFQDHKLIHLVMLSDRNYKKLLKTISSHKLHNWITPTEFWQKKNTYLSKKLTQYLLEKAYQKIGRPGINEGSSLIDHKSYTNHQEVHGYFDDARCLLSESLFLEKIRLYHTNKWLNYGEIEKFITVFTNIHKFDSLNLFNFYYNDKKLLKSFCLTLYLKQQKQEKLGIETYSKIDVRKAIEDLLKEPEKKVDTIQPSEEVDKDLLDESEEDTEDILISDDNF